MMWSNNSVVKTLILSVAATLVVACSEQAPKKAEPTAVSVIDIKPRDIILYTDFVGEVRGSQEIDIRARVSGVLLKQHFEDGIEVEAGQLLYSIDDRDLKEGVNEAEGALASAQSELSRATLDVDRYRPLVKKKAISRQQFDNAVAVQKAARAQVESAKAAVEQAKVNVGFATIAAPVAGRIGNSLVQEGDLITAGSTLMAQISNTDPAWVYFSVSEAELLDYESRHGVVGAVTEESKSGAVVNLFLSDGSKYAHDGKINFTDRGLDRKTGTYQLRAEFPNPKQELRSGLFARIRVETETLNDVFMVPDKAVTQQLNQFFVTAIKEDKTAERRPVTVGPRQGGLWVIKEGLKAGDQVIVEGIQKARPDAPLSIEVESDAQYFDNQYVSDSKG